MQWVTQDLGYCHETHHAPFLSLSVNRKSGSDPPIYHTSWLLTWGHAMKPHGTFLENDTLHLLEDVSKEVQVHQGYSVKSGTQLAR